MREQLPDNKACARGWPPLRVATPRALRRTDRAAAADARRSPRPDRQAGRAERDATQQLALLVAAADTTLGELHGLSTRSVAELLVEVGDPRRFTERGFARFNGSAPLAAWTAEGPVEPVRHRFNPAGNRRVNAILHRMAVTQLRASRAPRRSATTPARAATQTRGAAHPQAPPQRRHPAPHDARPQHRTAGDAARPRAYCESSPRGIVCAGRRVFASLGSRPRRARIAFAQDLNRYLRGWAGYLRYGNSTVHFDQIIRHADHRLRC